MVVCIRGGEAVGRSYVGVVGRSPLFIFNVSTFRIKILHSVSAQRDCYSTIPL